MNKILGKTKKGQTVPDVLEGATEHGEIMEKFRDVYSTLYNYADTTTDTERITDKLKMLISKDDSKEVTMITPEVIIESCKRLKPEKSDVSGSYSSEALLNTPYKLFENMGL